MLCLITHTSAAHTNTAQLEFVEVLPKHTVKLHSMVSSSYTDIHRALTAQCFKGKKKRRIRLFHRKKQVYIFFCSYYLSPTVQCVWKAFSAQFLSGLLCPQVTGPLFSLLTVIFVIRQARLGNLLCSANRSQSSILLHTHAHTHTHKHNFSMLTKLIGKHSCARSHRNTSKTHCSN